MGQNLFQIFWTTIKSKFASLVSKIKLWTSWNFVRTRIIGGIRNFFFKLLDVRPKSRDDYYSIFGWLVSKKLAYAIVVLIGVLSLWYIGSTSKIYSKFVESNGMRTYSYKSILLRLAKNKVRIKAKSGYIAYEGTVDKGYATGSGKLYSPYNVMLYEGAFEKNKYEGEGKQYYEDGSLHYQGAFHDNLYEGEGKLFRPDGTQEYVGSFQRGMKEGEGKLYDGGSNLIYGGEFASDRIVYSSLLGKTPEEIRGVYHGDQTLYEEDPDLGGDSVVYLSDIGALYLASSDGDAADDSQKAETVYVLSEEFSSGKETVNTIEGVQALLGDIIYEGNSSVILPEAVAINLLNDEKYVLNGRVDMDSTSNYTDDIVVNGYDEDYTVYVYSFRRGDLIYSFVCKEAGGEFAFYGISDGGSDEEAA